VIRRIPWWAALGLLALAARLAWRFGADEPLLYSHQYHYWEGALRIVEHPRPFWYLLHSDEWRQWPLGGPWTIAPLYYVFLAALLAISGTSLVFVQVVQSALDALVAVAVGHLGARAAGSSRGHWAGVAYALFLPAIQLCNSTMTEALHTPLLALAFVLLARAVPELEGRPAPLRVAALAGLAFGLGGLARTVGLAFVPIGAALLLMRYRRRGFQPAAALVLAAALPIVPWAVRNRVLLDDPSPIESASVANLLIDNVYVEGERYDRLEHFVFKEATPSARRDRAMEFVEQGLRKRYHLIPAKVRHNVTHFLRPEGLWILLGVQQPWPAWRHFSNIALDDAWLLVIPPLFGAWLFAGRGPLRVMLVVWTALYLFLILVVFHSEIRYRMPVVPYAMAGAAGGVALLARGDRRARVAALAVAALIAIVSFAPFAGPAWRGVVAAVRLQDAGGALARGDAAGAAEAAARAAAADPTSTWPLIRYARWLVRAGRPTDALDAYARAAPLRELPWEPPATRPALLAELGRVDEARAAADEANRLALLVDSWILLEVAWRALPPPRTHEVLLARGDLGAVRHFHQPRNDYRWSRPRALVRMRPTIDAPRYELVLEMGAPPPAPDGGMDVEVTIDGEGARRLRVEAAFAEYRFPVPAPADGVVDVEIRAAPWSRTGQPAAQGVAVRRVALAPVAPPDDLALRR
jgi:4-amino-4-deoxy-L-arabinose transferase-like glycosyltransferase